MKVVIDTNVLVSAALRDRTTEDIILFVVGRPDFSWIVSADILLEYRSVLGRPRFALPESVLNRWEVLLNTFTTKVDVGTLPNFPRDQKDAIFIACVLASGAEYLITGDRDLKKRGRWPILRFCPSVRLKD